MAIKQTPKINKIAKRIPNTDATITATVFAPFCFDDFCFPDGSKPSWDRVSWLQKRFMKWFNKERTKTILTFPVNLKSAA